MNKLLLVINSLQRCGGTERVASNLANYWQGKYKVEIVVVEPGVSTMYSLNNGIKVSSLNISRPKNMLNWLFWYPRVIWGLRKLLRSKKPDIVLGYSTNQAICSIIAGLLLDSKVLACEHQQYGYYYQASGFRRAIATIRRYVYPMADAVVSLTETDRNKYANYCKNIVCAIPNAIAQKTLNSEINREDIVLAVGRIDYQKGFDLLLQAWVIVSKKHPDWQLHIVGGQANEQSDYSQKVQNIISENALINVNLLPSTNDIYSYYNKASIFVLSSRWEGFPMVLLEAMSCGLPPVSFNCPTGPSEIIKHEENGLIVRNGDIEELAKNICLLIEQKEIRNKLSERACLVVEEYSPSRISDMWDALFEKLK